MQKSYRLFGLLKAAETAPAKPATAPVQAQTTPANKTDITTPVPKTPAPTTTPAPTSQTPAPARQAGQPTQQAQGTAAPRQQSAVNSDPNAAFDQAATQMQQNTQPGQTTTVINSADSRVNQPQTQRGTVTFKGGHAVRLSNPDVDWSTPERGSTPNNVKGTFLTDQQYAAYTDVANQLRANGVPEAKAKEYAIGYIRDQQNIARGGQANFDGRYYGNIQPKQKAQAPVAQPQAPAGETAAAPAEGSAVQSENSVAANTSADTTPTPTAASSLPFNQEQATQDFRARLRDMRTKNPDESKYLPVAGRPGLFTLAGDTTKQLYNAQGKKVYHDGNPVTGKYIADNDYFWLPGSRVMYDVSEAVHTGDKNFMPSELRAAGLKPLPGYSNFWIDPKTNVIYDPTGKAYDPTTNVADLPNFSVGVQDAVRGVIDLPIFSGGRVTFK